MNNKYITILMSNIVIQEEEWEKYNEQLLKSLLENDDDVNLDGAFNINTNGAEDDVFTACEYDYEYTVQCCNTCKTNGNCRGCNKNLSALNPESQYQRLKLIQNTVRVSASLYSMNIGALTVYQKPGAMRVNWNQMSDRRNAHMQRGGMSMRSSVSVRPGNISPGGVGCDIKHNSYNRYIAKLKAKKPLRQDGIPNSYGAPNIPFIRAFPVYGGKTLKTGIGAGFFSEKYKNCANNC